MRNDSPHIFAIHDYSDDWSHLVREAGKTAWCVHTEAVGINPNDRSGKQYPANIVTNIVRLNNGYGKYTGVIPMPDKYADFAQRCANFVQASANIDYVVLGNEIALEWEQPSDAPITLATYMDCYRQCYDAIKSVAPHVKIAPQAPAPWNNRVPDAQDWIKQLPQMLSMAGGKVDWICLHAYTKGYGLDKFHNNPTMNPPFQNHKFGWEALWQYMDSIPLLFRHLPVMITETNGDDSWAHDHGDWIQALYAEIDNWNKRPGTQKILCAALFRWAPHDDRWDMSRHGNAVNDFRQALTRDYRHGWSAGPVPTIAPKLGPNQKRVKAEAGLNLRSVPGGAVIVVMPDQATVTVIESSGDWWLLQYEAHTGYAHKDYLE